MPWSIVSKMLMQEANDFGGSAGGGGNAPAPNANQNPQNPQNQPKQPEVPVHETPEFKAALEQATEGLKRKNSELLSKNSQLKDSLKGYGDMKPEEVKALVETLDHSEDQQLIRAGKFDEALNRRTERMKASYEEQVKTVTDELSTYKQKVELLASNTVASAIKSAAAEAGALPVALADFVSRAHGKFILNDQNEVVAVDADGAVLLDADGKTPLSPLSWAKSLQKEAPHLFTKSTGAGAAGGAGGKASVGKVSGTAAERAAYYASQFNLPPQ